MHRRLLAGIAVVALVVAFAGGAEAQALPAPTRLSPLDGEDVRDPRPTLSWQAVAGATAYRVEYSIGSESWPGTELVPAQGSTSVVILPSLSDDSHVFWRVRGENQGGSGDWSAVADFWVFRDLLPPDAPADLIAAGVAEGVTLRWKASASPDATGYRLYVRPEGGIYANPSSLGRVTSTLIPNIDRSLTYDFMLTAVDASGNESVGIVATWHPAARVVLRGKAYPGIQAAADEAKPGDEIVLAAGIFLEGVVLPAGVSLRGAGPAETIIDASGLAAGVTLAGSDGSEASRSVLSMLQLRGGASGIAGGFANVRLENVLICRVNGPGIATDGGVLDLARVTIVHCQQDGLNSGASGSIVDALIAHNGGTGVVSRGADPIHIAWSDLFENVLGNLSGTVSGEGILSALAQFEDEAGNDFRVLPGDPTVDAGDPASPYEFEPLPNGGRVNIGAFGNTNDATPALAPAAGTAISTSSSPGTASSKSDRYCVVATASFGSPDQSSVAQLRALRDRVLKATETGSAAVATYENTAAPVAREIGKSEVLRAVVRFLLK